MLENPRRSQKRSTNSTTKPCARFQDYVSYTLTQFKRHPKAEAAAHNFFVDIISPYVRNFDGIETGSTAMMDCFAY